jgi:hypothetical protein
MEASGDGASDAWLRQVTQWCDTRDNLDRRLIKVVFDPDNIVDDARIADLIGWLDHAGKAVALPHSGNTMTIMQRAMDVEPNNAYTIILPRATQRSRRRGFYAALESLGDGVAYVMQPKFSTRRMDKPQIIVFARTLPDYALLAERKYDLYRMTAERALVACKE